MRLFPACCLPVLTACSLLGVASAAEITKESIADIKKKTDAKEAVLVDVREKREWDQGHIEGAIFLPLSRLQSGVTQEDLARLPQDKILYTHCVVGKRAVTAGDLLERHGFKVRAVKPGYKELLSAGFPKAKE